MCVIIRFLFMRIDGLICSAFCLCDGEGVKSGHSASVERALVLVFVTTTLSRGDLIF